jgi:hypothetical protein
VHPLPEEDGAESHDSLIGSRRDDTIQMSPWRGRVQAWHGAGLAHVSDPAPRDCMTAPTLNSVGTLRHQKGKGRQPHGLIGFSQYFPTFCRIVSAPMPIPTLLVPICTIMTTSPAALMAGPPDWPPTKVASVINNGPPIPS